MYKQYLVSIKKKIDVDFSKERYITERIASRSTIVDDLSPKMSIIDILSEQFRTTKKVSILNRVTGHQREFEDKHTFISWVKKLTIEKLCEIEFYCSVPETSILFSVKEYLNSGKSAKPKLLNLEIKNFITDELIIQKDYSDFKELDDFVQSLIDPAHKKFLPNNPCINIDCRFVVNGCDITDYFLQVNDIDINCYEADGTQVLEFTNYRRLGSTTIHHVLAIEEHEGTDENIYIPRLVYSSVIDDYKMKKRVRGIADGHTWEKEIESYRHEGNLYYEIVDCGNSSANVSALKNLLDQYSSEHKVTSFVCIEMTSKFRDYEINIREYGIQYVYGLGPCISKSVPEEDYSYLIPPHEKWTYEDYELV